MPSRPDHSGIHRWAPSRVAGVAYCTVCDFLEYAAQGHQCSGIRGQLGRPIQDLPAGVALGPPEELADHVTGQSGSNGGAPRSGKKRRGISPASPAQRAKCRDLPCAYCGNDRFSVTIHPAHLIDRSLTSVGQDDPLAVIPLCAGHHRAYDELGLDLSSSLEPRYRDEQAFAVARVGLFSAVRRITNRSWVPAECAA